MTSQQVALLETASTRFSPRLVAPEFSVRLAARIGQALRAEVTLSAPEIRLQARDTALASMPENGCFAVLGAQPSPHKVLLDIDPSLGLWAVERLLAGEAAAVSAQVNRPPTDLELGVLTYLLLDVMSMLTGELSGGAELALVLDRMVGTSLALQSALQEGDEEYVQLGLRLQIERRLGYVRLLLPESLLSGFFGAPLADADGTPAEFGRMRRCLSALPEQMHELRVVGAHIGLSADEIANVEVGDIIVLEQHQLTWKPDAVTGSVMLRLGHGKHGGVQAQLFDELGESRLEITSIVVQHDVERGADMADAQNEAREQTADNLPQTEHLLRDVDASVAVELGRLKLNTAQLIRLKQGQVLRLARSATEPVDLVVGGKLFARGELLEVDGELGVRLTHVTGSPS